MRVGEGRLVRAGAAGPAAGPGEGVRRAPFSSTNPSGRKRRAGEGKRRVFSRSWMITETVAVMPGMSRRSLLATVIMVL